jgi:peroxiredoxin Q/BCP
MSVEVGQELTNFKFNATSGVSGSLSDYRGKTVVLYFYPKDSTPGCTQQGQDLTKAYDSIKDNNVVLFGVSRDSLASHEKFKEKQGFPFELISDSDSELCDLFEVVQEKSMFGKKYMGIVRSTFVIDEEGCLSAEYRKVSVKDHLKWLNEVLGI